MRPIECLVVLVMLPFGLGQSAEAAGDPSAVPIIVALLEATTHVESFLLGGGDAAQVHDPDTPNVGGYAIVKAGPSPDPVLAEEPIPVIREAADPGCGRREPCACEFAPRYAFRFHAGEPPFELLVDEAAGGSSSVVTTGVHRIGSPTETATTRATRMGGPSVAWVRAPPASRTRCRRSADST